MPWLDGAAGVEAEPADPQQRGADHVRHAGCAAPCRLGRTPALADHERRDQAATPALMCTTVPPAKSSTPACRAKPPPQTQCATGRRRTSPTAPMNHSMRRELHALGEGAAISAGVMMAKVIWNIMKTFSGIVLAKARCRDALQAARRKARRQPPITPLRSPPLVKASCSRREPQHRHQGGDGEALHQRWPARSSCAPCRRRTARARDGHHQDSAVATSIQAVSPVSMVGLSAARLGAACRKPPASAAARQAAPSAIPS